MFHVEQVTLEEIMSIKKKNNGCYGGSGGYGGDGHSGYNMVFQMTMKDMII